MKHKSADDFFDDIDFVSVVSNVKGIMTSDGTMSTLLDFERVLDEADLYAYQNWELGELVQGPDSGRYSVSCVFMWPYKLMPDPSGAKRLANIGCNVSFKKGKIKVPVEVKNYEDFVPGTRYPKGVEKKIWFVCIEIPKDLMNEIKEGSIDLADQTIDLDDIENAYEDDLDKENTQEEEQAPQDQQSPGMGGSPSQAGAPGELPAI
jgi:hypothetical protein